MVACPSARGKRATRVHVMSTHGASRALHRVRALQVILEVHQPTNTNPDAHQREHQHLQVTGIEPSTHPHRHPHLYQ